MLMAKVDYVLDTNRRNHPKMITGKAMFEGLEKAVNGPFRVVPFFDPGPWGRTVDERCLRFRTDDA